MSDNVIHALVLVQNWGEDSRILDTLKNNRHVISLFHVMGRHSYLIDANFDDKAQLAGWVDLVKGLALPSGVPAVMALQTQRVIDVFKKKEDFTLGDYLAMKERYHFFVKIDCPHRDDSLLKLLRGSAIVHSILHVQGENSLTIEVITGDYEDYRALLGRMKKFRSIYHIETQEVISVVKYRNMILGESGKPVRHETDIRELYTL